LTPVGQEIGFMASLDPAAHQVRFANSPSGSFALFDFLLIPPAWSISIELQFYAIAPWLVRRSIGLLAGLAAAATSLYFVLPGIPGYPLGFLCHYSLLTEVSFFILGIFAYRVLRWLRAQPETSTPHRISPLVHGTALVALFAYPWMGPVWRDSGVALTFAACIPWIFLNSARTPWDRAIGELSYPFYLVHWIVMRLCYAGLSSQSTARLPTAVVVSLVIFASLAAAAALHYLVERPVDRYRQERLRRAGS
jgi:peptidoglycan/LPS O-acetylase OafA/YrhL